MKTPIILRADDGLRWCNKASVLESYVESPDIDDGIYTVWDCEGQVLSLASVTPAKWTRLFGFRLFVSVSPGILSETGRYEPNVLHAVIASRIREVRAYKGGIPAELSLIVLLLCRLQSALR